MPQPINQSTKIAILGAGSWGATLARVLALADKDVTLWTRDESKAARMSAERHVEKPLSIDLPENILVSSDLEKCLAERQVIMFACSSQAMRSVAQLVKTRLKVASVVTAGRVGEAMQTKPVLISVAKGLELASFLRMSEVLAEVLPGLPVCTLSGPNLAFEILKGLPTATVIACKDGSVAKYVQSQLTVSSLRLYSNDDIIGVELGGAFKNVIAIAAGGVDGLALGANAKAALMTRGLAEMTRLAVTMGARAGTMAGLAGLGDLMATCSSDLSRNYRLGWMIARGTPPEAALASLGAVAEGVNTARAVCQLAEKMSIELPIAMQVEAALKGDILPHTAIMNLMTRPLVSE